MLLHQTKKLPYSNGSNQQSEEVTYKMGQIICKLYAWEGVYIEFIRNSKFNNKN
jgi:hypothetical protein